MDTKVLSRRAFLRVSTLTAAGAVVAGCAPAPTPQVVKETVVVPVEQTLEVPVKETVVVEVTEAPVPTPAPTGPVKLVWMAQQLESMTDLDQFLQENPDIQVDVLESDETRYMAMLAAGQPPDVFGTDGRHTAPAVRRGLWLNLDPFIEVDPLINKDNLFDINDWMRFDGMNIGQGPYYGLVQDWGPDNLAVWINETTMQEAGLPVYEDDKPVNFVDAAEHAKVLTIREGDRTLRFGLNSCYNWAIERLVQSSCMEEGGRLYDEYFSKASLVENEPARRALQWLFDMQQAHAMPSPIDPAGGWEAQLWTQGRIGMMNWIGYWFSGALRMWAPENESIQALMQVARMKPSFVWGPKNIVVSNGPTADAISATTKYPEQSWRLLKCFIAGYLGEKRAAAGWGLPPVKSNMKLVPSETDFDKRLLAAVDAAIKRGQTMPHQNPFYSSDSFGDLWVAEAEKALSGNQTFDEAIEALEAKVNEMIAEGIESTAL